MCQNKKRIIQKQEIQDEYNKRNIPSAPADAAPTTLGLLWLNNDAVRVNEGFESSVP